MIDQPLDLDAIQARADAATEGPWARSGHNIGHIVYDREGPCELAGPVMLGHIIGEAGHEDAEFIAHAREDVPALVAELREAREQCDVWRKTAETKIDRILDARHLAYELEESTQTSKIGARIHSALNGETS